MTDINETNANMNTGPVVVLPKTMSVKTFNRIYGGHETLGGVYKLHQNPEGSRYKIHTMN